MSSYDSGPGSCISLHAEMNAIAQCAQHGGGALDATLYTTYEPCPGCWKLIRAAGLNQVIWPNADGWLERRFREIDDFQQEGAMVL